MEWIVIGIMLAIGWFLAPYVIMFVLGVIYFIWMALTGQLDDQNDQKSKDNTYDLKNEDWHEKH